MKTRSVRAVSASLLAVLVLLPACQALREVANLRNVDFAIDRVTGAALAGVDLGRYVQDGAVRYDDLRASDVARLTAAIVRGEMPLDFTLHLAAENPADNRTSAQLVRMDWTLFLNDRETISGIINDPVALPPGQPRDIPITIRLDLVDFFDNNARDLVDLALSVAGAGGRPQNVRVQALPTIDTPIGPIRYPEPITIVSRDVGTVR